MLQTLYRKTQISITETVNRLIYTLCRNKWISMWITMRIPETLYVRRDIKKVLGVLAAIYRVMADMTGKVLFFFCLLILPTQMISEFVKIPAYWQMIWSFIALNCLWGSYMGSKIFIVDQKDYLLLHQLRVDPREHFITKMVVGHVSQIAYYGLFFAVALLGTGVADVMLWIRLMIFYAAFRPIGEAVRLVLNDHMGIPIDKVNKRVSRCMNFYGIVMVIMAYGLYPLMHFTGTYPVHRILLSIPVLILAVAVGGYSVRYLRNYPRYPLIAKKIANYGEIQASEEELEQALDSTYKLEEKDVSEEELTGHLFEDKEGYVYLNALFFQRHKKLVRQLVRIKVIITGGVFGAAMAGLIIANLLMDADLFQKTADNIWEMVNTFFPILVFVMYCASSGKTLTRSMFYNCDNSLLKYGYYRTPEAILMNFRIRLRYMIRAELPLIVTFAVGGVVNTLLLHQMEHYLQLIAVIASAALLSVFYSVIYLCMYYIFQPYTEKGAETGFGYRICSGLIYLASYSCLQIHTTSIYFAMILFGVMVVSLLFGYIAAYRLAPKRFILK